MSQVTPAAETAPAGTTSVTPSYLPPGTTLLAEAGTEPGARLRENQYQLPGAANADTIPAGGLTDANALDVHPATQFSVSFLAGVTQTPDVPADPEFVTSTTVEVGGFPALLTVPRNGLGVQRVDWVDQAGYHTVLCERLRTAEGISGLTPDEMVRVAASLYH